MNIKNKLETQFYRIRISEDDFREALECLKEYKDNNYNITNKALLSMAVICYSRPFIKSSDGVGKGHSVINIRLKDIFNDHEISLHKKILSYRNKAIAHSDYENKAIKFIESSSSGFSLGGKLFDIQSELINIEMLISMCKSLLKYCVDKMFDMNRRLHSLGFEP